MTYVGNTVSSIHCQMQDTTTRMPAVSFIVPAFNAAATVGDTLRSLQSQTRNDWEAIVVDDGSTDATAAVARKCADPRVRVVGQPNLGLAGARNTGLRAARSEYVTFLDADDVVRPEFAKRMLETIGNHDAAACWYELVGPELEQLEWTCQVMLADLSSERLLSTNPLAVTVLLRRASLTRLLGKVNVFDQRLRVVEDWDLWLRLARAGLCWAPIIESPLVHIRLRRGSLSQSIDSMYQAGRALIETHADTEAHRRFAHRRWDFQYIARFLASGEGERAASMCASCSPMTESEWSLVASMYLAAMQRTLLVGPATTDRHRVEWEERAGRLLAGAPGESLVRALRHSPSNWRNAGREFAKSLTPGATPVIYAIGRNGREALLGACDVLDEVCWIDDRPQVCVPKSVADRCRRISCQDLTTQHIVLVTPSEGEAISSNLRAMGVRVYERSDTRIAV